MTRILCRHRAAHRRSRLLLAGVSLATLCATASAPALAQQNIDWDAGTGSWFTGGNWSVGNAPSSVDTVFIENGGTAQVGSAGAEGSSIFIGGNSIVEVSGAGRLTGSGSSLYVGYSNAGSMRITGGGQVVSDSADVGFYDAGVGSVTIDGPGSRWTNDRTAEIGYFGSGTMTLSDGGTMESPTYISLGRSLNSQGTLHVGRGGAAGFVEANRVHGGAGVAILNFGHDEAGYHFTRDGTALGGVVRITGSTEVNHNGTGTTILLGTNTFSGELTVMNGVLRAGAENTFSPNSTVFAGGGLIDLDGHDQQIGTLSGYGDISLGAGTLTTAGASGTTTYSGVMTGSGGLTKQGGATLILTGENEYTGDTRVEEGILQLGSTSSHDNRLAAGSAVTVLSDGALLIGGTSQRAGSISGEGAILGEFVSITGFYGGELEIGADGTSTAFSGTLNVGTVNKTGSGTQTLSGTHAVNTLGIFDGAIRIGAGGWSGINAEAPNVAMIGGLLDLDGNELRIGTLSDVFVPGTVDLGAGGSLILSDGSTTFEGDITGDGSLVKQGTGTFTLGGVTTFTGLLDIEQGRLRLGTGGGLADTVAVEVAPGATFDVNGRSGSIGSLAGDGEVELGGAALAFGGSGASTIFGGAILGPGNLVKTGSGVFDLTGSAGHDGGTVVDGGTLLVNGTHASGVSVSAGARLGGSGTVGPVSLDAGAAIAPGNSIGTLNVTGDQTFASGSTYEVEVDPSGAASDLIHATGTAFLDGATVRHVGLDGTYVPFSTYTILTADTGLDGRFGGAVSDYPFLDPRLSYDSNNVYLELLRNDVAFDSLAATFNQRGAAAGIESLGIGDPIYNTVLGLAQQTSIRTAFDALSGEIHASAKSGLLTDSGRLRDAAMERIRDAFDGGIAQDIPLMAYAPGRDGTATSAAPRRAYWTQARGSYAHLGSDGNAAAMDSRSGSAVFGADMQLAANWRGGVAVSYGHSHFSVPARASTADVDSLSLAAYAGAEYGPVRLRLGAAHHWHRLSTNRAVAFPGFAATATADYAARTAQVFGEAGYQTDIAGVAVEPFAGLAHVVVNTGAFAETGPAGIVSAGGRSNLTMLTGGVHLGHRFMLGGLSAKAHGTLGWRHAIGRVAPLSTHALAGGTAFTVAGVPLARNAAIISAGLDLSLNARSTLSFGYDGQWAGGAQDHAITARFSATF